VGTITTAWSALSRRLARERTRFRRADPDEWESVRLGWVRSRAPGHTFVDVGGLFTYMGDIALLAEQVGATGVTLFDVGDPDLPAEDHLEWGSFQEKRDARRSAVRYLQGDLEDPESVRQIGPHDYAFYSGVLYHTPNPFRQLMHLRAITRKEAFLSTLTIPEVPGFDQACIFYPYLDDKDRTPYAAGYGTANDLLAIGRPVDERPMYGYGNCWWGISRSALRAMLRAARFEVVAEPIPTPPFITVWVLKPLPLDPMLPPLAYFRERGEARERGEPRWNFDTWYDEHRVDDD
jgi:hypothetical protein